MSGATETTLAGAMACTPKRKSGGLEVVFHELRVGPAVEAALHR